MSSAFSNPNIEQNRQKRRALVLIQGTGSVRAGIWTRSVCINENLELGSMFKFLERCNQLDIPVLVMNPNMSRDLKTKEAIPFCHSMPAHAVFVWEKYVQSSGFDRISVVAHSAGGGCVTAIHNHFKNTFFDQVDKLAYTDSFVTPNDMLSSEQR